MTFGGTLLENVCGKQHDSYPFSKLYTVLQKKKAKFFTAIRIPYRHLKAVHCIFQCSTPQSTCLYLWLVHINKCQHVSSHLAEGCLGMSGKLVHYVPSFPLSSAPECWEKRSGEEGWSLFPALAMRNAFQVLLWAR